MSDPIRGCDLWVCNVVHEPHANNAWEGRYRCPGWSADDEAIRTAATERSEPIVYEWRAATIPISAGLAEDLAADAAWMRDAIASSMDRAVRPWRYPDRNPFPIMVPLPWLERGIEAASEARARIEGAFDVLRYGVTESDDW